MAARQILYVVPRGCLQAFCAVYSMSRAVPPVRARLGNLDFRNLCNNHHVAERSLVDGRNVDELLAVDCLAADPEDQIFLVGFLNPQAIQLPVNTLVVNEIRGLPIQPMDRTMMSQRELANRIRAPAPMPSPPANQVRSRMDVERAPPGAPPRARRRRVPQRRQLDYGEQDDFVDDFDIDDDMEMPDLVEEEEGVFRADARRGLERAFGQYVQGAQPVEAMYFRRGGDGGDRGEGREILIQALAGQMFAERSGVIGQAMNAAGPGQPVMVRGGARGRDGPFAFGVYAYPAPRPVAARAPPPSQESQTQIQARLRASLNVTSSAEKDTSCPICACDYATLANAGEEDRVLRVSILSCAHEMCSTCADRIISGEVNHGRAECPQCAIPMSKVASDPNQCVDCLMSNAPKAAPANIVMYPCEHRCLCSNCASTRLKANNFNCPVCIRPISNWRVV